MDEISKLIRERLDRSREDKMFRYEGQWIQRGWTHDFVDKLNRTLDDLGIDPGAPIGFAPFSRPDFIAAMLALIEHKRPIVMIYSYQSGEAVARKMKELALPVIIADETQWDGVMEATARELGTAAISISMEGEQVRVRAPYAPKPGMPLRGAPDEAGIELLSSGTTGPPKQFPMSYDKLFSRMVVSNSLVTEVRNPFLLYFPLGNISGIYTLVPSIAADAPMIVLDRFRVADWLDFIREVKPVTNNLPPAAFRMILDEEIDPAELAGIKYISTGAATLDPSLRREFEEKYDVVILQAYGATELGGVVACVMPEHIEEFGKAKSDSVGRPMGDNKWRVVDPENGGELTAGEEGRLEVFAPAMSDEWIVTTDLCMIDDDGFLYHRGRLDGAIVRGGFKIIPELVAQALMEHPGVASAAVVGLAAERLGQVPVAAIELRDGIKLTDEDLEKHLRGQMPGTNLPTMYKYVEKLPRTPSLKVDLEAVKRIFA